MTNLTELLGRFDKLAALADGDEDVGDELRVLAHELEQASESAASADDVRALLSRALDARAYAERIDRWREISRRRKLRDKDE